MAQTAGLFITVEGIEGSGKSSLIAALSEWLQASGRSFFVTREPGGTQLGRKIRELLLSQSEEPVTKIAELLLFSADRAQHVAQVLQPALKNGHIVLCDRYLHSTLAYQGSARGIPEETLQTLIGVSTGGLLPDLVLLLDLDPRAGLLRAKRRSSAEEGETSWSRFEEEKEAFHRAVREGFLRLANRDKQRFCLIDAAQSPEAVLSAAKKAIEARFHG